MLRKDENVEFVAPSYRRISKSSEIMFITKRFIAQFKPEVTKEQIHVMNSKYNVRIVKSLNYVKNGYVLEAPDADGEMGPISVANLYYEAGTTIFSHPDFIIQRHLRTLNSENSRLDHYLSYQWHLEVARVID